MASSRLRVLKLSFLLSLIISVNSIAAADSTNNETFDSRFPPQLQFLLHQDLDKWEPPEEISKGYPYYLSGFDDENRPIWVTEFGKWDVKKAVETGGSYLDNLDKYINQWIYRMLNSTSLMSTPQNPVTDFVQIMDMEGYTVSQLKSYATVSFLMKKGKELHFALGKAETGYIVNASFIAESLVSLMKPIFGKDMERVEIFGTNRQIWVPKLLRRLPRDQLAEQYGGMKSFKPVQSFG